MEPQALTGLCVFLFVLFVLELAQYRVKNFALGIILGMALGVEFGIEGWQGLALAGWFGLVHFVRWIRNRKQLKGEYGPLVAAVAVCTIIYFSYFALGIYAFNSSKALSIRPFWWALTLSPVYFPVEYGPMLLLGIWGLWRRWKRDAVMAISMPMLVLLALILFQIFFLTAEVLPEFGLLRGNRLLPLVLLGWTACFFEDLFRRGGRKAQFVAFLIVFLALPTFFTDIRATSNVEDRSNLRIVRPSDFAACEWIKRHLPENAIVQGEPDYIGHSGEIPKNSPIELSLIANFAERRMVLGEGWISSTIVVNSKPIAQARHRDLLRMFKAEGIETISAVVKKYGIDYLYVGTYEQQLYPGFLNLLQKDPQQFREVYSKENVHILSAKTGSTTDSLEERGR